MDETRKAIPTTVESVSDFLQMLGACSVYSHDGPDPHKVWFTASRDNRDWVLDTMVQQGYLTRDDHQAYLDSVDKEKSPVCSVPCTGCMRDAINGHSVLGPLFEQLTMVEITHIVLADSTVTFFSDGAAHDWLSLPGPGGHLSGDHFFITHSWVRKSEYARLQTWASANITEAVATEIK